MGSNKREREQDELLRTHMKKSTGILLAVLAFFAGTFVGIMVTSVYMQGGVSSKVTVTQSAPQEAVPQLDMTKLAELEAITKAEPNNAAAWATLGHFYYDSDLAAEAVRAYERSLELAPRQVDIWSDLGVMYRRIKQFDKAINSFDQAAALNPKHVTSRFNKGIVLLHDLGDDAGALAAWKEVLAIDPAATTPSGGSVADLVKGIEARQ